MQTGAAENRHSAAGETDPINDFAGEPMAISKVTVHSLTACEPPRFWAFTMENDNMAGSWEGIFEAAAEVISG